VIDMNGVINVLKPPGMTSSDVVVNLKKKLRIKKVGHTGTLDPAAAGVLPICFGKATKLAEYITSERKVYRAEMVLGIETNTYDADGKVISQTDKLPDINKIREVFAQYQGNIRQKPPLYSAIKYRGRPMYALAREGHRVDIPYREVTLFKNSIIRFIAPNRVFFEVECSKGTYIRSLCHDMGKAMGCGAHLSFLLRIRNGMFSIEESWTLDEIERYAAMDMLYKIVIPMDQSISHLGAVFIQDSMYNRIINGSKISCDYIEKIENMKETGNPVRVYCNNQFIGIGFINDQNMLQMKKVML